MLKTTMLSLAALAIGGCATVRIPADRLEHNEASMRSAEEVGALAVPAARLHLQMAKDQTESAKAMAAKGDSRAPLVLARAESDAELALVMAREASVHAEALKAAEELKAVQARGAH